MNYKKVYRKKQDAMICGVCAGLGEYLGVDPTILRLIWVLLGCTFVGMIAYFVAAVIIPYDPNEL